MPVGQAFCLLLITYSGMRCPPLKGIVVPSWVPPYTSVAFCGDRFFRWVLDCRHYDCGDAVANILVIDDDRVPRMVLKALLESHGHIVIEAGTGIDGERALASNSIDMIFTDIFMPKQDGIQTIVNIRKVMPNIPIVAMSTNGHDTQVGYLKHARLLGANLTFEKPIKKHHVEEVLSAFGLAAECQA